MAYNKKCIVCSVEFLAKVDHKITCSEECRKKYLKQYHKNLYIEKFGEFDKKCLNCKVELIDKSAQTRYCSKTCENKLRWKKAEFNNVCEYCKTEFIAKEKDIKCCSLKCKNSYISQKTKHSDVELVCRQCSNKFIATYIDRNKLCCSQSCSTRYTNSLRDREAVGNKISETLIRGYADGSIVHGFIGKKHTDETKVILRKKSIERGMDKAENNPMFGKKHSKESRQSMSKTKTACILQGKYAGWFSKGKYFSNKLEKEIYYQSSWEKQFFEHLDTDALVSSFVPQPLSIPYYYKEYKRHYIPDIMITYLDGSGKLVEIKPSAFVNMEINKEKFAAARAYCAERNIQFEVWTEKESPYLSKNI